jgi:phenylacetic acid degradation operon negative regulatory protein
MRPDNIDAELGPDVTDRVRILRVRDDDPADLATRLWDLPAWAQSGHRLLDEMAAAPDFPGRFVVAAATVRHLLTDPVVPDELLPADWPGARLRAAYHDFAAQLLRRREPLFAEAT